MIACLDAAYDEARRIAHGAMVGFDAWGDEATTCEHTASVALTAPYEPGALWKRELDALLAALAKAARAPTTLVVDGYVELDADGAPGLGAHLHAALGGAATVIGVAKNPLRSFPTATRVSRGASARPLFVTARGIAAEDAARAILAMHGAFRIPTQIRRVDQLARRVARGP